ncbi:MAG: hypothetical protein DHS20C10_11470 [marine bacterium B5-7]|nr:MAG: hypothetical protein DHS20C10_11470 [marine bacterium B5-7]
MSEMHPTSFKANTPETQQAQHKPLSECMRDSMRRYLTQLNGEQPFNLYDLVLEEIESPLLETVMIHCKGNQSKAARMLGLSRGTLRTKLKKYFDNRKPGKGALLD